MLKVNNLSKQYKGSHQLAVNNVSFELNQGEIVGLIGGNGAGKTTIMKMMAKSLKPSEGNIEIKGKDIFKKNNRLKNVNFMIEAVFFTHITAYQNIQFFLEVNQQDASKSQIKEVMNLVDLWRVKDQSPKEFSFGMKQRLGLAMCMASEPEIVVMDEPFAGLDPNGVDALIERLKEWARTKQMSILVSSHQLSELEAIADRYIYIENGEMKQSFNKKTLNSNIFYLRYPVPKNILEQEGVTLIQENIIKIILDGESLNELIAKLSHENIILKIEKDNDLKEVFKGGK